MSQELSATTEATSIATRAVYSTSADHFTYPQRRSWSWGNRIVGGVALTCLSLGLLASGKAEALSFTFEKIVDTNTPIPSGTGTFDVFSSLSLDNGDVAFQGLTSPSTIGDQQNGIYTSIDGVLDVVADITTPIPGGTDNFVFFDDVSLSNGNVAFFGNKAAVTPGGIYTSIDGVLDVVVDENTLVPEGTGTFRFLGGISLDNQNVAFEGTSTEFLLDGIYTSIDGVLDVVADITTPIPGGTGTFNSFKDETSLDNGNVAFSTFLGIYTSIDGVLDVVADTTTPIPGGTGTFGFFLGTSLDNEDVVFIGSGDRQDGIYTSIDGVLDVVADTTTPIPGGTGTFDDFFSFTAPSVDNGNVAFTGFEIVGFEPPDPDNPEIPPDPIFKSGIYTNIGGMLAEVIAEGDLLDSKKVSFLADVGNQALSGNQIVLNVGFTDDSRAIYVATAVPEPSSVLGTLAFSAFGAGWMLKRNLKKQKLVSRAKSTG